MSSGSEADHLSRRDLAILAGTTEQAIRELTERGILEPVGDGVHRAGDAHRLRILAAFGEAGVTVDALVAASRMQTLQFTGYDELHQPPGRPSTRTYAEFRTSLGARGERLGELYTAFGLVGPDDAAHVSTDEERFLTELVDVLEATGRADLTTRLARVFGDAAQRSAEAAMGLYAEASGEDEADPRRPPPEVESQMFAAWGRVARFAPDLASWLSARHLSSVIDAYSVTVTEAVLAAEGYIAERPAIRPAIAFVDLAGFTRLTEERGDRAAAQIALRLGDLAAQHARRHLGRVVKLLGDGVLMQFPDAISGVDCVLDLLAALPAAGLPPGHAGVHDGPLITRDGDVFGQTVNLAARVGDAAPTGMLYITESVAEALAGSPHRPELVGSRAVQGIGDVRLYRLGPVAPPPEGSGHDAAERTGAGGSTTGDEPATRRASRS